MGVLIAFVLLTLWFGITALIEWRADRKDQALCAGVPAILGAILIVLNLLGVHA